MKNSIIPCLILQPFLLMFFGLPAPAQQYQITDLGALGGSYSEGHGVNSSGGVVGDWDSGSSPFLRGFYYHDGANYDLPTLGGVYGYAYGINDANQIVGESTVVGGFSDTHAFVYENGAISDLGTLGGSYHGGYSSAHGINWAGQIVGESSLSASQINTTHAVLYSGGRITDLGGLGGNYSGANAINNSNVIVGSAAVVSGSITNIHAFEYCNGVMRDLGTLGGGYSSARGINDSGIIVGEAETVTAGVTNQHAFVYRNGLMTDLGTFGGSSSSAGAINASGQVVGYSYDSSETSWAFLYNGTSVLNLVNYIPAGSGWTNLTSADAIDDQGQIAGSGLLANGAYHAFLLTPVTAAASPIALESPVTLSGDALQVSVQGTPGTTFIIQVSTNLVDWANLCTNSLSGSTTNFTDTTASASGGRFYRGVSVL